jgi:hypothetical protein
MSYQIDKSIDTSLSASNSTTTTTTTLKPILKTRSFQFKSSGGQNNSTQSSKQKSKDPATSFKSIEEDIEDKVGGSTEIPTATNNNQTTAYDETFESDDESRRTNSSPILAVRKKLARQEEKKETSFSDKDDKSSSRYRSFHSSQSSFETRRYTDSFESVSRTQSFDSTVSIEDIARDINQLKLSQLKKSDYVAYARLKVKLCNQTNVKEVNVNKTQVNKLISRIKTCDLSSNLEDEIENYENDCKIILKENLKKNVKVYPFLVNKLRTLNSLNQIKVEQTNKIEHDFGSSILAKGVKKNVANTADDEEKRNRDLYLRLKTSRFQSELTNKHFINHEINYCDSIMLIADLARNLPKHSESPEVIWSMLMKPLTDLTTKY